MLYCTAADKYTVDSPTNVHVEADAPYIPVAVAAVAFAACAASACRSARRPGTPRYQSSPLARRGQRPLLLPRHPLQARRRRNAYDR